MPIKPIDLQTLFMQLSQVGREQSAVKEGAVLQQSIQGAVLQKKREDEGKSIQKPEADERSGKIRDRESGASPEEEAEGRKSSEGKTDAEEREIIKDPNLGRRVDISG